jgi:GTP-binding nuclear protein Ran
MGTSESKSQPQPADGEDMPTVLAELPFAEGEHVLYAHPDVYSQNGDHLLVLAAEMPAMVAAVHCDDKGEMYYTIKYGPGYNSEKQTVAERLTRPRPRRGRSRPDARPLPSAPSAVTPEFKVLLVGDGGVGKTTLLRKHLTGKFAEKYVPTMGATVHRLQFRTTRGPIIFNCWDTAGQERMGGLRDGYYLHSDAAIIVFDLTSRSTYMSLPNWHRDVGRVCGAAIPTVVCGSKADMAKDRKVRARQISYPRKKGLAYWDVSARSNYQLEMPFLDLARRLVGDDALVFVEAPAYTPPEAHISSEERAEMRQGDQCRAFPLPGDDEDDGL